MSSTTPNPSIMQKFAPKALPPKPVTVAADISPSDPGRIVRPGLVEAVTEDLHDGVVKAKHLKKGQRVRPYLHGEPRGSERVVESAKSIRGADAEERGLDDGAYVEVTYATPHPPAILKAAYRFHDTDLAGTPLVKKVPAFVAYSEV